MIALIAACARAPADVRVRSVVRWDGASVEEVEAEVTIPLEQALAALPGARDLVGESVAGWGAVTVTVPASSATEIAAALDGVVLPADAHRPWGEAVPDEITSWLVPPDDLPAVAEALGRVLGLGGVWAVGVDPPAVAVRLPAGPPRTRRSTRCSRTPIAPSRPSSPSSARRPRPSRPASGRRSTERRSRSCARPPLPIGCGACSTACPEAPRSALPRRSTSSGSICGERASTGPPSSGCPPPRGPRGRSTCWRSSARRCSTAHRSRSRAAPRSSSSSRSRRRCCRRAGPGSRPPPAEPPPPRTSWDVVVDPDRAAALGVAPATIATAIRRATAGERIRASDGWVVVRVGPEVHGPGDVAALDLAPPIRVGDVASVATVSVVRKRVR